MPYVKTEEAARRVGVSKGYLYRNWQHIDGARRLGRNIRWDMAVLTAFMEAQARGEASSTGEAIFASPEEEQAIKEERHSHINQARRAAYAANVAAGLCGACGGDPHLDRNLCVKHLQHNRLKDPSRLPSITTLLTKEEMQCLRRARQQLKLVKQLVNPKSPRKFPTASELVSEESGLRKTSPNS